MKVGSTHYADYNMLAGDGGPAAGICHARGVNRGMPPVWMSYLPVRSLSRTPMLSITGEQLEEFPLSRIAGALILPGRKVAIADGSGLSSVGSCGRWNDSKAFGVPTS